MVHRMKVTKEFLQNGMSFEVFRSPNNGLRRLLEYRIGSLPLNAMSEMIPLIR